MVNFIKYEKNGCMPCKKMDSILNQLGVSNIVEHRNTDEQDYSEELQKFGIQSLPALVRIDEDNVSTLIGVNHTSSEFKSFFEVGIEPRMASASATTGSVGHCENGVCSL